MPRRASSRRAWRPSKTNLLLEIIIGVLNDLIKELFCASRNFWRSIGHMLLVCARSAFLTNDAILSIILGLYVRILFNRRFNRLKDLVRSRFLRLSLDYCKLRTTAREYT